MAVLPGSTNHPVGLCKASNRGKAAEPARGAAPMIVELTAGATLLVSVVGAVVLSLLGTKIWARLASAGSATAPTRRRRAQRSISLPVPWTHSALRALAFASYTSMGVYLPTGGWEDNKATCVMDGSQVLVATIEGETLVVDCLVLGELMPAGDRRLWVPFTLRARLPHPAASDPIPAPLRRWIETGAPIAIWIGQQGGVPFVLLTGAGARLTLTLRSPANSFGQQPGMGLGQP